MDLTRRDFIAGAAAAGCCCALGCTAVNPAPVFESADGTIAIPDALAAPGSQIKVRLGSETVLVWRTGTGFEGASIACTHLGSEVHLNPALGSLDCPSHGSRYNVDGTVLHGPAKRALKPFTVTQEGDRLRITG